MSKMSRLSVSILCVFFLFKEISGHGMMLEPPNRSSLWRFDDTFPEDTRDDTNWCGGPDVQWNSFDGKCGICGDQYDAPHPQDNENTGKYGLGKVVREYAAGSVIDIEIKVTLNHMGYFEFSICALEDPNAPEPGDECFQPVNLATGEAKYQVVNTETVFTVNTQVQLPEDLTCERCVLRWDWTTDNVYGECADGTSAVGCGPKETFRSCSDIAIV